MASEMQNPPNMKMAWNAILSLILVFCSAAFADESACVKTFRKGNDEYFKTLAATKDRLTSAQVKTGVSVGGGLVCIVSVWALKRSIPGVVACSVAMTAGTGVYGTDAYITGGKIDRLSHQHRIYVAADDETSDMAKEFVKDVTGVDAHPQAGKIIKELSGMMENGALCEGSGTLKYQEVVGMMKTRMQVSAKTAEPSTTPPAEE